MEITHNDLKKITLKAFKNNKPLMIWGSMGLGKSEVVKESTIAYAESLGKNFYEWNKLPDKGKQTVLQQEDLSRSLFLIDIRLSQKDPSDLTGIPFIKDDHMKWFPPSVIKLMSNPTCNAVLFFDELSDASVPVMKAAYQLVLDKCSGEVSFSEHVRVIAAGNRSGDKCGVNDTPKALDNRFMHVELSVPSSDDWSKWAMNNGIDNRLVSFIMMNPIHLCMPVKDISSKAFPTPRSVAMLSDMIKNETDRDMVLYSASACCGDGFGTTFLSYIDNAKDVDPIKICNDPQSFNKLSLGAKWFSLSSLSSHYKSLGSKVVDKIIDVMQVMDPDMAFVLYFMNKEANNLFPSQMQKLPNGQDMYLEFSKYILSND